MFHNNLKRIQLFIVLIALVAAACSGNSGTAVPSQAATAAYAYKTLPPIATSVSTSQPVATVVTTPLPTLPPGCRVTSQAATPGPEQAQLMALKDYDWAVGPETAQVTIIEYSDFQ